MAFVRGLIEEVVVRKKGESQPKGSTSLGLAAVMIVLPRLHLNMYESALLNMRESAPFSALTGVEGIC